MKLKVNNVNEINLKAINVKSNLPESLNKLDEIAQNIWWSWDSNAKSLFRNIDREAWVEAASNPVMLLNILSYEKLKSMGNDTQFIEKLNTVYADFQAYMMYLK
jgi:starch phosphorylase